MPPRKKKKTVTYPVVSPSKGVRDIQDFCYNVRPAPPWQCEPLRAIKSSSGNEPTISQLHAQAPPLEDHELAILHQRLTQPDEWEEYVPETPQEAVTPHPTTPELAGEPGTKKSHRLEHKPQNELSDSLRHVADSDDEHHEPCEHCT